MADESFLGERLLPDGRRAHHGMEQPPIVDDREDRLLHHRLSLLHGEAAAQFENQSGISILPGQTSLQLPHWMHRL